MNVSFNYTLTGFPLGFLGHQRFTFSRENFFSFLAVTAGLY